MTETIADRIRQRLEATGLSARAASIQATGSPGTIQNIFRGASDNPRGDTIQKLAKVLGVTEQWLLTGGDSPDGADAPIGRSEDEYRRVALPSEIEALAGPIPRIDGTLPAIPVLGAAMGSIISEVEGFHFEGGQVGYVRRPPSLASVMTAYAVMITGDSMDPMHRPGEVRLVNPTRPTAPGDTVIVVTKHWEQDPGQAYIKILRRRTASHVIVDQLNPAARLEIPRQYVQSIHYVLTMNDILGF